MQKASRHPANSNASVLFWNAEGQVPLDDPLVPKVAELAGLRHIVCMGLQVLFHSPSRGSFHLSLAVLVHYRLPRSI